MIIYIILTAPILITGNIADMKDSVAFDDLSKKLAVYTAAKKRMKKAGADRITQ